MSGFSATVYIHGDVYDYARETKDEGQSVNQRIAELAKVGKEAEEGEKFL